MIYPADSVASGLHWFSEYVDIMVVLLIVVVVVPAPVTIIGA
jgi:predicted Co/Zn/Cd cation transporter (cation efflux family)